MKILKLMALDKEDLSIVSAYMQDAVIKADDLDYQAKDMRFLLARQSLCLGRIRRQAPPLLRTPSFGVASFNRVTAVRSRGFSRREGDKVLSLLTINFVPGDEAPAGTIELIFSGDAAIELSVECIEAQMSDLGAAWETEFRPNHPLSDV